MKAGKQNEETLSKEAEEARKEKEDIETQIAQLKEKARSPILTPIRR